MAEVLIRTGFVLEGLQGLLAETRKFGQDVANELNKSASGVRDGANALKYYVDEAGRARNATGRFVSAAELAAAGIKDVGGLARYAGQGLKVMDAAVAGLAASLTNSLTNAIGAAAGGLKGMVADFLKLDGEIRKAAAAAGEQGAYDRLSRVVDQVGIDAAGTTMEVAQMATSLVRAGFSVQQTEQSLGSIVRGAEATGTSFEQMGDIVGATIKGFGLQATDTTRVVDALVQGANGSATSVSGMGMAFKYAAPVAKVLGVSVEDLAVAIGLMTNAGITAEMTGVTLRNGLTKLAGAAPAAGTGMRQLSGQAAIAARAMKTLQLDIYNADGTLKPMEETLLKLKAAFDKLEPSSKLRIASDLFGGEDDGAKWLALLNQSQTEIKKMAATMKSSKGATDTARTAMQGLGLELQQLTGTLGSLGTSMGGTIGAALRPLVAVLNAVAGAAAALPGPIKSGITTLLSLYAAVVLTKVGLAGLNAVLMVTTGAQTARAAWVVVATLLAGPVVTAINLARAAWIGFVALGPGGMLVTIALIANAAAILLPIFRNAKNEIQGAENQAKTLKAEIRRKDELNMDTSGLKRQLAAIEAKIRQLKKEAADGSIIDQAREGFDVVQEASKLGRSGGLLGTLFGVTRKGGVEAVVALRQLQAEYKLTADQARALYYDAAAQQGVKNPNLAEYWQIQAILKRLPGLAQEWVEKQEMAAEASERVARSTSKITIVTLDSLKTKLTEAEQAIGKIDINDRMGLEEAQRNAADLKRQIREIEEGGTMMLQNAQREVELASQMVQLEQQRNGLVKDRLQAQQQLQSALMNYAQAQEAATRSEYEVLRSRNSFQQQQLERELQMLRERGDAARYVPDTNYSTSTAFIDAVAAKEQQIAEAKRQQREIEIQATAAAAQAATVRFELERRILALKQAGQVLEAQDGARTARSGVLEAEKQLLSLQQKQVEMQRTGATDVELQQIDQQINLQKQAVALSGQRVRDENSRMQMLGTIFGLEQQTLGLQQQSAANAIQAQAAGAGMEQRLSGTLQKLQESAGAGLGLQRSIDAAGQSVRVMVGEITAGGQTVKVFETLPPPMFQAADAANQMAAGLATANQNAGALLQTLKAVAGLPRARWAGGGVEGGQQYQVNELGQESLLDRFGRLRMINAARSSMWTAPTSGVVLPAGITADLANQGMIEGTGNMRRGVGGTVTASQAASSGGSALGRQVARLAAATGRLEKRMSELVAKRWDVTVALPGNASSLRLSQALI